MTLKLQINKQYEARNGWHVTITDINVNEPVFPYVGKYPMSPINPLTYKEDGSFVFTGIHDYDLIKEVNATVGTGNFNFDGEKFNEIPDDFDFGNWDNENDPPIEKECVHEWLSYQGLFEKFRYCKHCDKKV